MLPARVYHYLHSIVLVDHIEMVKHLFLTFVVVRINPCQFKSPNLKCNSILNNDLQTVFRKPIVKYYCI